MAVVGLCAWMGCGGSGSVAEPAMEARLQEAVDDFIAEHLVPGAAVAVIDHGRQVEVVSGIADLDSDRAVTVDTQFRVASVTKMYMATIALRLVERGDLSLDEPLGVYASAVPDRLAFVQGVSLRQLLSHTTGLSQTFTRDEDRHSRLTIQDRLDRIPPPVCNPGDCWSYADGNYVIAQLVLEAATGQPLTELFRRELIAPSDLNATELIDAAIVDDPLPPQYALVSDDSGQPLEPRRLFEQALPRYATLVMTAGDAARFADALFGGEVLDPALLAEMLDTSTTEGLPCPDECPYEYGLGVFRYDNVGGHELLGHDGSSGTVVVHDVSRDLTIAILTNGGDQHMGEFLEAVVEAVDDSDG